MAKVPYKVGELPFQLLSGKVEKFFFTWLLNSEESFHPRGFP